MDRGIPTLPPSDIGPTTLETNTSQTQDDDGDHGTATAVAVGVTVSVVVLLLIAGIAYWYYRKKYPVRMIVGRDFAKFSNPAYSRRQAGQTHTLVRDDADSFFQQTQPTGPVTLVLGDGDEEAKVCYVNTGFQYDSQDADEEEVERRFRQQKAYLFKKDDDDQDEVDHGAGNAAEEDQTDGRAKAKKDKSKVNGQVGRDHGHENAAFSGDSDVEGEDEAKEAADAGSKKDKTDTGSTSSGDFSASKKAGKAVDSGNDSPQEIPGDTSSDTVQQLGAGMTVRDFLQLAAREKRALSDVNRARADSDASRTFDFDVKKSARRRAQSAGDIWTSAVQSLPSPTRVELLMNRTGATTSEESAELPDDSNGVPGTYENWTSLPDSRTTTDDNGGITQSTTDDNSEIIQSTDDTYENLAFVSKTTDDIGEIAQSDEFSEITEPEPVSEVKLEEEEKPLCESGVENSYFIAEGPPASGSNEIPSHATEDDNDAERTRTDSSTSEGSYEKVVSSEVGNLQSAVDDVDSSSVRSQQEEDVESSQGRETQMTVSSSEIVTGQEDEEGDYVNVDRAFQQSSLPAGSGASAGVEQSSLSELSSGDNNQLMEPRAENTMESSQMTLKVDGVHTADDMVDGSALLSTPMSGSIGSGMDKSDTLSFETIEDFKNDKHPSGNGPDEAQNESLSSSLVILDKSDLENQEAKDDDSDNGSFKTGISSYDDKLSTEDEDFDRVSHDLYDQQTKPDFEHEGVLSLGSSEQSSTGTEHRASVQVLPTLTYSDHSSLSSNEGVEPKKDETADASRLHEPQTVIVPQSKTQHAVSGDEGESTPLQHTFTTGSRLSAETGQPLPDRSGSELAWHSAAQETTSSPPQSSPLRGLAALRTHPDMVRPSESESEEGMELSAEDIKRALEGSDDSSEEDHGPQPPQTSPSKTPVKIAPTEKFVFSEEVDEDIDV